MSKKYNTKEAIEETIDELLLLRAWNTIDRMKIIIRLKQIMAKSPKETWEPMMWTDNNSEYENNYEGERK